MEYDFPKMPFRVGNCSINIMREVTEVPEELPVEPEPIQLPDPEEQPIPVVIPERVEVER